MTTIKDLVAAGAIIVVGQIDRNGVNLGRCLDNGAFELNAAGKRFASEYFTIEVQAPPEIEPPAEEPPAPVRTRKPKAAKVAPEPVKETLADDADLGAFLNSLPDE